MNNNTLKIALYLRVSTQEQTCEIQERELLKYVEARGWAVFKVYEDKATGTNGNRASLKALMEDAKAREFDIVACWKLDRLFRSLNQLVNTLKEFEDLGIKFISIKDQIDMTTASGRLMTHLVAAFAEFEASMIQERVRSGLANAKAKGKKLGRPAQINPVTVYEFRQNGMSLSEIAKHIGVTKSAVSKTLKKLRDKNRLKNTEITRVDSDV